MRITSKDQILHSSKPEGVTIDYYLFAEYELHYNEQVPHSTQVWHHHEKIWETIFIIEGELIVKWKEDGEEKKQVCRAGDVIETEHTLHTFMNSSENNVKFLVIKQVLSGENKKDLLKTDKVIDQQ